MWGSMWGQGAKPSLEETWHWVQVSVLVLEIVRSILDRKFSTRSPGRAPPADEAAPGTGTKPAPCLGLPMRFD